MGPEQLPGRNDVPGYGIGAFALGLQGSRKGCKDAITTIAVTEWIHHLQTPSWHKVLPSALMTYHMTGCPSLQPLMTPQFSSLILISLNPESFIAAVSASSWDLKKRVAPATKALLMICFWYFKG
jgi:hypothetical protein